MERRWSHLPATLKGERPLSTGARLILLGTVYDRNEEIEQILATTADFDTEFEMSIYITLGASQQEALLAGRETIDARSVLAELKDFWSIPYPFCCWRVER